MSVVSRLSASGLCLAAMLAAPLASQAATCAGFTSGAYVAMNPLDSDPTWRVNLLQVDATTLTVTDRDGSTKLKALATPCKYQVVGHPTYLQFNKRGLFFFRGQENTGAVFAGLGLPVRKLGLSNFVGTWNFMRQETADSGVGSQVSNGLVAIGSTGVVSVADCDSAGANCASTFTRVGRLTANAEGGFTLTTTDNAGATHTERFFGLKQGDGSMMLAGVGIDHDAFTVIAPTTPRTLPTLGEVFQQWELTRSNSGVIGEIGLSTYRIMAVDEVAQTFRRKRVQDCRVDNWTINSGRVGMAWRAAARTKDCSGLTVNVSANLSMSLRDTFGIGAFGYQAPDGSGYFGLALSKP